MVNYQLGKIYKLTSEHSEKIYIGSTCKPRLCDRKAKHVSDYKRFLNGKCYNMSSFDLIKLGEVDIVLLEKFPCNSKDELLAKEKQYIKQFREIAVNQLSPIRTKIDLAEEKRKYYKNNLDKIKAHSSEKITCLCGKEYTRGHKSRHEGLLVHHKWLETQIDQ